MSDFVARQNRLQSLIAEWENFATPTADEHAQHQTYLADLKQTRLAALKKELAGMQSHKRWSRKSPGAKRHHPADAEDEGTFVAPNFEESFFAYPKAMHMLKERLSATREELAAWVSMGPKLGGIAAYTNVNELEPPPSFYYYPPKPDLDYLLPLMICWFIREEVINFDPDSLGARYITGSALIERWRKHAEIDPVEFIRAKVAESRLQDLHPSHGLTQASIPDNDACPPLESGLFSVSEIDAIEETDFGAVVADRQAKNPGRFNYDPDLQVRANEIAKDRVERLKRHVTKNEVAKHLAEERGLNEGTVLRRIRKQW